MKRHIQQAELSAFLDGETRRPAQIERHIAGCPQCARAYAALKALSSRIQGLEAPEVRSGFRTRVIGNVREQAQPARGSWPVWRPFAAGMAMAAVAALALIAGLWAGQPGVMLDTQAPQTAEVRLQPSEDALLASIETPYAEASDTAWLFASAAVGPEPESESVDELLVALANIEYFDHESVQFAAEPDINTAVVTMDDDERTTFLRLLTQIAREDAAL